MLNVAFKEWAVVCRALAVGRQAAILRKGGIAEAGGVFRPEHDRFWLYPTFVHQQAGGTKPDAAGLLAAAEPPPPGTIRFTHFAAVEAVRFVDDLDAALALDALHVWTPETVRQRFAYRTPGLYVLAVRVFAVPAPLDAPEHPAYAGCKTWVELDRPLPTDGATPVLDDARFAAVMGAIA
jgi:hypothetical protein